MLQLWVVQESAVTLVYNSLPVADCDRILMPGVNLPQYDSSLVLPVKYDITLKFILSSIFGIQTYLQCSIIYMIFECVIRAVRAQISPKLELSMPLAIMIH